MTVQNEFSELLAVDICFGAYLLDAFDDLMPTAGPAEFQEFLTRSGNEQIFRHDAGDIHTFLKDFMYDAKGVETTDGARRINYPHLPIGWFCRKPGLAAAEDMQNAGSYNYWRTLFDVNDEDEEVISKVRAFPVTLTYQLSFAAREKLSLDKLLLAMMAHITDIRRFRHRFQVPYLINGAQKLVRAEVMSPLSLAFTEEAGVDTPGNYFAAGTTIDVTVPVILCSNVVTVDSKSVQWLIQCMGGCRG